ncbi:MAG: hypothetical protein VKK32_08980 [Candidatus Melainabacteria bacterium]|nr:hypothetical protein [Candidatus Melainabacteria bacterium]
MEINDLDYYKILLQNINNTYENNILGDQNYSYTVSGEVTPITGNEIIKGVDPIKGYNHTSLADGNYNNISDLSQFQNSFLSTSKANLIETNKQIDNFMINVFGIPAGDGVHDMMNRLDYNPSSEMLKYLGEYSPEVKDHLEKLNFEYDQNQISIRIYEKEQSFINRLNVEATFSKLGAAEKTIFLDVLNSYDELVTNYESEVQNSGIRHLHGNIPEDGMICEAFSEANVAAMKLNKAKDMLKMLSEGMKADDIEVYEKTYDYEIEFNEKLVSAVKEHGIGSPEANLLSAQAEASRRTRLYVESVHAMQTSTDALDIAVVNQWENDGYDPLDTDIINDMQADIINQSSVAGIQALYKGDQSKYALAMDGVTSIKEKALALTNVNRDGAVSTTEIATLLVDAAANGNKVDGINLDVLKAALAANGVTSAQITNVETLIDQIDTNNDGQMSFDESLAKFNAFDKSQGRAAFNDMMNVIAATKVDQAANPSAFTTIGTESFFTGDYSTQDKAVLSAFLASNGRYVHTTEEKFEALDAFHDNAGNTTQQRSDWRDYQWANWAQSASAGDVAQDNSLAWSFKNGANVSGFLEQMQEMTDSRTQMMMDSMEYGNGTSGFNWWGDFSLSYFEVIRDESNVLLVGQRGGTQQDGRLMDMIGEALQISYADIGNYHTGINVNLDAVKDNISGVDKVELKYFADNVTSFGTTDITYDANLVNQSLQQYYAMWGLRAGLYENINKISEPESKLIENKFGALMDVGDQMEAYLLQNKALGADAKETDEYRALEEQWFNNYDLINGIIRGDTSIDKAVTALGGIKADGSIAQANIEDVVQDLQSAIINGTDDTALDFNSDGNVDSADYDALRMVIGDRRNESAFDALMTQDSLNLSKLAMYSGLAKNTTNVNAHDQAIYSQLENYYADQSEVNNYIATNSADSSFASEAEKQRFIELANQLDELNEAVEFDLRSKLNTNTPATINAELKAKADKASNEMVLLSLGLSKDDSAAIAAAFKPGFKITEALNDTTEMIVQFVDKLKEQGRIDSAELIAISTLIIEENPDDLSNSEALAGLGVLSEYVAIGANENELASYMKLVISDAPQDSLNLIDDYIRHGEKYQFSAAQEDTFLEYLSESKNANIAKTYVNFIKEGANAGKLTTLNDIFEGSGSTIRVLKQEDLRFKESLDTLKTFRVDFFYYSKVVDNFSSINPDTLNEILETGLELCADPSVNTSRSKRSTTSAIEHMLSVAKDPLIPIASSQNELLSAYPDGLELAEKVLSMQLNLLKSMNQDDAAVIAAKANTLDLLSYIPGYIGNPDDYSKNLNATDKKDYEIFLSTFPAGSKPTAQQSNDALELIQGDNLLGGNQEFLLNYGRLVATGDVESAGKLAEIARFIGSDKNYTSMVNRLTTTSTNMSVQNIEVAYQVMEFSQSLAEQNYSNVSTNIFMLETILTNKRGFNASIESDRTIAFFDSLEDTLEDKPATLSAAAYDKFITGAIAGFGSDLYSDGAVNRSSSAEQIKNNPAYRDLLGLSDVNVANLQIGQLESMIDFFNLQITQESAKEQPNTGKIDNYRSQINSHQAAINSLRNR